jgi:hypothetical protein
MFQTQLELFWKFVQRMKKLIAKYKAEWIGVGLGALAGWCYWYFVGCTSGGCAITSSPVNSTLYGMFMGGVLGGMLKQKRENKP